MSKVSKNPSVRSSKHRSFGDRLEKTPEGQCAWSLAEMFPESGIDIATYAGEIVAVLDSGVPDHVCLSHLASGSDVGDSEHAADLTGHATAACGLLVGGGFTVMGFIPSAKVMPVKVTDDNGIGNATAVAAGIVSAMVSGAKVVIVTAELPYLTAPLEAAITKAGKHGTVVVADVAKLDEPILNLLNIHGHKFPQKFGVAPHGDGKYREIDAADFAAVVVGAVVAVTGSADAAKVIVGL